MSAIDLARDVLKRFGTFRNMTHTDTRDWKDFKGLGNAKVAHIQAALEIGRRFREDETSVGKQKIKSAKDVVDLLMPQMRDLKTEVFKIVHLDSNNRIIDIEDTATGTVNHAMPIVKNYLENFCPSTSLGTGEEEDVKYLSHFAAAQNAANTKKPNRVSALPQASGPANGEYTNNVARCSRRSGGASGRCIRLQRTRKKAYRKTLMIFHPKVFI